MTKSTIFDNVSTIRPRPWIIQWGKDRSCGFLGKEVIDEYRIVHGEWHCVAWHDDNSCKRIDKMSECDKASS
jgi:hypothetical protein